MNRPCNNSITCPGPAQTLDGDDPIVNFSSEAIDGVNFDALSWPVTFFLNPFNPDDPNNPPSTCASPTSQADADLCAIRRSITDHNIVPQVPHGGSQLFGNTPQSCVLQCPDGSPFIWEVPAGTFLAYDVLTANQKAAAYACQQAAKNIFCIFSSNTTGCLNQPWLVQITASGGVAPYNISVVAGTLPPGVGFFQADNNHAFFSGQPSAPGTYPVAIRALDSRGIVSTRTVILNVMEISNANAITTPVNNTPYVFQLQGFGGVEPFTFSLAAGTLPTGLQLSTAGTIAGVPTGIVGTPAPFSVKITDATGANCTQQITFPAGCAFFNNIVWPAPVINLPSVHAPPNAGSVTPSFPAGNRIAISGFTSITDTIDTVTNIEYFTGNVDPNGYSGNCTARVENSSIGGGTVIQVRIYTQGFSSLILDTNPFQNVVANGTFDFPFTIPPGTTQIMIDLLVVYGPAGFEFAPFSASGNVAVTFGV